MTSRASRHLLSVLAVLLAVFAAGCGTSSVHPTAPAAVATEGFRGTPALHRAIDAQEQSSAMLLELPGVVGTSAGLDAAGRGIVRVLVARADVGGVPATVNGLRVEKVVTGVLHAWSLTGMVRPLAIGVSLGNANECLPGTLGCIVQRGPKLYALSANHVLARQNQAAPGEAAVQPSLPDLDPADCTAVPPDAVVGELADFQRVFYDGRTPNVMDAAIAEITLSPSDVTTATPAGYYGQPGVTPVAAALGMPVMKLARTTGLTHGVVIGVNTKVKVTFPSGTALFTGQVETSKDFGAFGDSGGLVVTDDASRAPVGMVIGGDAQGRAIVTPIDRILSRFAVRIAAANNR